MSDLLQDMIRDAKRAVAENVRHSEESLYALLCRWFPEATDDEIEQAVRAAL